MDAFMDQYLAIFPKIMLEADAITQAERVRSIAEKTDLFRDEHQIIVIRLGKFLDPADANFIGVSHPGTAGIDHLAFGERGSFRKNEAFLFFGPDIDRGQKEGKGGQEAFHEMKAVLISKLSRVAQGRCESFQIIASTYFDGAESRGEGGEHLCVEEFEVPRPQMIHEITEGDL